MTFEEDVRAWRKVKKMLFDTGEKWSLSYRVREFSNTITCDIGENKKLTWQTCGLAKEISTDLKVLPREGLEGQIAGTSLGSHNSLYNCGCTWTWLNFIIQNITKYSGYGEGIYCFTYFYLLENGNNSGEDLDSCDDPVFLGLSEHEEWGRQGSEGSLYFHITAWLCT